MKPKDERLAVVTASLGVGTAISCIRSWYQHAAYIRETEIVEDCFGVVPAFAKGVRHTVLEGAEIIACFHDDLLIEQSGWDLAVQEWFNYNPRCLLVGFGGGKGLGHPAIYAAPYDPMQLARVDFVSNMRDAEAHGRRVTTPQRVACLDGFSQIGRADFMQRSFQHLMALGVVHHAYDSHLGVLAAKEGGEVWMLPVACHHYGGRTAVGSQEYQAWAKQQNPEGDHGFWVKSHELLYNEARGILPLRF